MTVVWTGSSGSLLGHRREEIHHLSFRDFLSSHDLSGELDASAPVEQVVHAAAIVGTEACEQDKAAAWAVNVQGTIDLLTAAAKIGARRFFLVSTSHVYKNSLLPLSETSPVEPKSYYALTKFKAEELSTLAALDLGIELCVVRVFSIIGAARNSDSLAGLILRVLEGSGETIRCASDTRDFQTPRQYTENLDVLIATASLPPLLNLGSGAGMSVGEAAQLQAASQGKEIGADQIEWGFSGNPSMVSEPALFQSATGLHPRPLAFG
jgi:UDP-glucose 4-epimerase/GDP-4-dehydro-6-deoxy-D-mannose reductase